MTPETKRERVTRLMRAMSPSQRRILHVMALLGERPMTLSELSVRADGCRPDLFRAEESGMVRNSGGRYRVTDAGQSVLQWLEGSVPKQPECWKE